MSITALLPTESLYFWSSWSPNTITFFDSCIEIIWDEDAFGSRAQKHMLRIFSFCCDSDSSLRFSFFLSIYRSTKFWDVRCCYNSISNSSDPTPSSYVEDVGGRYWYTHSDAFLPECNLVVPFDTRLAWSEFESIIDQWVSLSDTVNGHKYEFLPFQVDFLGCAPVHPEPDPPIDDPVLPPGEVIKGIAGVVYRLDVINEASLFTNIRRLSNIDDSLIEMLPDIEQFRANDYNITSFILGPNEANNRPIPPVEFGPIIPSAPNDVAVAGFRPDGFTPIEVFQGGNFFSVVSNHGHVAFDEYRYQNKVLGSTENGEGNYILGDMSYAKMRIEMSHEAEDGSKVVDYTIPLNPPKDPIISVSPPRDGLCDYALDLNLGVKFSIPISVHVPEINTPFFHRPASDYDLPSALAPSFSLSTQATPTIHLRGPDIPNFIVSDVTSLANDGLTRIIRVATTDVVTAFIPEALPLIPFVRPSVSVNVVKNCGS